VIWPTMPSGSWAAVTGPGLDRIAVRLADRTAMISAMTPRLSTAPSSLPLLAQPAITAAVAAAVLKAWLASRITDSLPAQPLRQACHQHPRVSAFRGQL
jgi:hypothetical protein